jgi:hypothetical protein
MSSEDSKIIQLTPSQAKLKLVNANVTYALMPRGAGKTNALGDRVDHLSQIMPRSQILLYADTFKRLEERIVPNMLAFFANDIGLEEGVDFVSFKKPPDEWDKPIIPLKVFDHVISFSSGLALCLASQQVPGSANAYNAQAMLVDEAKYIKEEIINTEALPALRGAFDYFGHLPEYRSHWYFTDKYGANIKWLLAKKRLSDPNKIKAIISLQMEIIRLEQIIDSSSLPTQIKYRKQLDTLLELANNHRREMVYYCDAPPYENIAHLGEKYFRDLKRDLSAYEYEISVENKDPNKAEHSFYPALNPVVHYHTEMEDTDTNQPLIIALDYNWRITPMVVLQFGKIPGSAYTTLNVVNAIHTLHPIGGIELTVKRFAEYYKDHSKKHVHFIYDHTAVGKRPDGNTFSKIVMNTLNDLGWTFTDIYMGGAPEHNIKMESIKKFMVNQADMAIRINQIRCQPLITSIENAAAKSSMGKTHKDKSQEKNLKLPAEEQTDYSDAFDTPIWAILQMKLLTASISFQMPISIR